VRNQKIVIRIEKHSTLIVKDDALGSGKDPAGVGGWYQRTEQAEDERCDEQAISGQETGQKYPAVQLFSQRSRGPRRHDDGGRRRRAGSTPDCLRLGHTDPGASVHSSSNSNAATHHPVPPRQLLP
jgi:hypothetical protein